MSETSGIVSCALLLPFALTVPPFLTTICGLLLVLLVACDVYATILDARARAGPISEFINRNTWYAVRHIAFRFSRAGRHRLLNLIGPLMLPALIAAYIVLLVSGFALIYYPRMPSHFNIDGNLNAVTWFDSFYYSSMTLTTVGYGDITPMSTSMRFVSMIEGATGFALISLSVTYLITVYRALERKRIVALSFYHQAGEGADVAGFIAHHFVAGRFYGLDTVLNMAARDIQELLESHVEHPIIHYFHPVETYKSLPRILFLTLETCAVIHSCLDPEEYPETTQHPEVRTLRASAGHVLEQLVTLVASGGVKKALDDSESENSQRWRRRYLDTRRKLSECGIKTCTGTAGWEEYRKQRAEWETSLNRFASYLGYEWDEITGDRDLDYAADEEKEELEEK